MTDQDDRDGAFVESMMRSIMRGSRGCNMTFREWLEEKLSNARENSNESSGASINSYGAGWDGGFATAIHEILYQLPTSAANCPMEDSPSPQDTVTPHE